MAIKAATLTTEKVNGRYYTPAHIVNSMLDLSGYCGSAILEKHIMENSCGDGAFLAEIVRRYCDVSVSCGVVGDVLIAQLERYIHGIEIDENECQKCIARVNAVVADYGVFVVDWNIQCADTLTVAKDFKGKMDFVIGNPPYVRVHNLSSYADVKQYSFAQDGMTDLYIVFYEIGLSMLNKHGVLCYINPSSVFNSVAANTARRHFISENLIKKVVDLKHYQPFEATTYTTILVMSKGNKKPVAEYYEYDDKYKEIIHIDTIKYSDFYINGSYYFADNKSLSTVGCIMSHLPKRTVFDVKNGFATLYDSFFIDDFDFEDYIIPIVKASTGRMTKCLFPYDNKGNLLPYDTLTKVQPIRKRYEQHRERLKSRSLEKSEYWYAFGRSQGIQDVHKKKYAINTLLRDVGDIKLVPCNPGVGVYSGLYVLTELDYDELKSLLFTDDFIEYVAMLGKYKSGGYYTYSSKDLLKYLDYKYAERTGE
ncbi:MAG: SAM-dependent methyltransferase [Oscillospiraceae bacterium]|jgi:adenine-specific DNA-methyltransferase|nr:SAM-dependent methyltransferase [Oscillospiraceae bacterium]